MNPVQILLRAYYERLHSRMEARREALVACIDRLLPAEIAARGFGPLRPDQIEAYREASLAFIDERLESYNPIGIQYTFDRSNRDRAAELEFQIDWYDSRAEFQRLVDTARVLASEENPSDKDLAELANELIYRVGAFPDHSIIAGYVGMPTLQKLPDFLVASAIEEVVCQGEPDGD